ncbi:hypothetical protein V1478_007310 [Vespula squamosa]|uniref:Uncharacterized protein n=1 Tax=Vespula squamosa TaxID=30214 RepID=A0ABD2B2S1_VESSQ
MKRVLTCENHEVPLVLRGKSVEFFCNIPDVTRLEDKMKGDSLREKYNCRSRTTTTVRVLSRCKGNEDIRWCGIQNKMGKEKKMEDIVKSFKSCRKIRIVICRQHLKDNYSSWTSFQKSSVNILRILYVVIAKHVFRAFEMKSYEHANGMIIDWEMTSMKIH